MSRHPLRKRVAAFVIAAAWSAAAPSQMLQELPFLDRGRNPDLSVAERAHPELDPLEVRLGSFIAAPSVDFGIQHDSNIYALQRNPISDWIITAGAVLAVRSDWQRNEVNAGFAIDRRRYIKADDESTTNYRLDAGGRADVAGGTLDLAAETARVTESRSDVDAPGAADRPIRYNRSGISVSAERPVGRLTARAGADWHRYRFDDAQTVSGTLLRQDYRDRDILTGLARIDAEVSPALALYVDGSVNRRSYNRTSAPLDRDSSGYTIEGGADFDITRLLRGHVQAGYLSQNGKAQEWSAKGISGRGRIEWFARPVLTVTVEGGRSIQDSAQTDTPAYLSTDISARADYELLRSLIITVSGGYTWDRFEGVDRRARRAQLGLGVRYRMGRHAVCDLNYQRLSQRSPNADGLRSFADSRFLLSVRLQR